MTSAPLRRAEASSKRRALSTSIALAILWPSAFAVGGVVTDGSVGAAGAIGKVGNDFPIPHTLGTKVGGNLFHSFSEFNLTAGESGTFTGPGDVSNVLARVTGGSPSSIDGTLRSTIPGANLFFINPKGVVFSANAKLEIDGSFTATTADYLKFSDGARFNATPGPSDAVLSSVPVSAFGFLASQPAAISATSSVLTGASGKKMSFVGGGVALDRATLTAPSGRIELLTTNSIGEVAASNGAGALGGSIDMLRARADASGAPGGTVVIRGGRLMMDRSSVVSETTGAAAGGGLDVRVSGAATIVRNSNMLTRTRGAGAAGDVSLQAGSVNLSGPITVVGSQALATATSAARSGKVSVTTGHLAISNEGTISASTFGPAAGGRVDVQAQSIAINGLATSDPASDPPTGIFSNTAGAGASGGVRIRTNALSLTAGGAISADTFGLGKGGDVQITAKDIFMAGRGALFRTGIFADSGAPDRISPGGQGGSIEVKADRLQIVDGGLISTKSVGLGAGGDTTIDVRELVIAKGDSPLVNGDPPRRTGIAVDSAAGPGRGGNLRINADELRVTDGGSISAGADGTGPGGNISIHARNIVLNGRPDAATAATGITADSTSLGAGGAGGDIEIVADHLQIFGGARITASTFGGGAGGDVTVRAQDAVIFGVFPRPFTGIAAESLSATMAGKSGNVRVEIPLLEVRGFGRIAANTFGPGDGGDVEVITKSASLLAGGRISADTAGLGLGGSVTVTGNSLIISGSTDTRTSGIFSGSVSATDSGAGGTVHVRTTMLRLADFGSIAATSTSSGAGGSVNVQAQKITLDTGASIAASATSSGGAGSVSITVQQPLELRGGSAVRTTSTVSDAGTVEITSATDIDLKDSTVAVSALVGNAGQVSLRATGRINLLNSSVVAEAGLNGGNVFIDPEFVLLDHSRISANAILGAGGNILIIANTFLASSSAVTASSEASVQGTVQIQSLNVDLSGALVLLPTSLVDVSTQLREQCARRLGMDFSSFLVLGRGGTERTPDEPLPAGGETQSRAKARR